MPIEEKTVESVASVKTVESPQLLIGERPAGIPGMQAVWEMNLRARLVTLKPDVENVWRTADPCGHASWMILTVLTTFAVSRVLKLGND